MKILELLKQLEWSCRKKEDFGHGDMSWVKACPSCGTAYLEWVGHPLGSHEPDCELAKAIRELEGEPGESVGEQGISLETVGSHRTNPFHRPPEHVQFLSDYKPSWEGAPEWAQWLAMDANRNWYWFEDKPEWHKASQEWFGDHQAKVERAEDHRARNSREERPRNWVAGDRIVSIEPTHCPECGRSFDGILVVNNKKDDLKVGDVGAAYCPNRHRWDVRVTGVKG